MRNVDTFAGLTFALALAFSLTTAAWTSSMESKQQASPDQSRTDSARNVHRDRVDERLKWLSQQLNLTKDQKNQLKPILAGEFKQMRAVGEDALDRTSRQHPPLQCQRWEPEVSTNRCVRM